MASAPPPCAAGVGVLGELDLDPLGRGPILHCSHSITGSVPNTRAGVRSAAMSDAIATPIDIVRRYLTGLSDGDVERVLYCVAEGFVNEHTSALGSSSEGREEYRRRLPDFLAQFEGLHYELVDTIYEAAGASAASGRVAARYRLTASFDGHAIDIPGVMLIEVEGGEIVRRTDVWDSLTFLRQTGAG
jgi:ketosteroid isomerase-like protein